jgi:hypothetical protein
MKARLVVLATAVALAGCGGAGVVDSSDVVGADDTVSLDNELSTAIPVGSVLQATTGVNLRKGASTSYSVILVVPTGGKVTTVDQTTPTNGFYKVKYNGSIGFSHGAYYKLVSSPTPNPTPSGSARDNAIVRAKSGVGFSYWWGHARFVSGGPNGSNNGSCSGNCPSCTHGGSYGGDCSGLAGKVWSFGSSDLTVDSHPYSTVNFKNDRTYWHSVNRGSLAKADALVYNQNGAGHVFIYESGDGWNSMWAYECKGCAYGCVRNLRSAGSEYVGIGHNGW